MNVFYQIVIVLVVSAYYIINKPKHIIVRDSILLSKGSKIFHLIMIWIIPFLWYWLFKDLYVHNISAKTREERERSRRKKGGFYESGKGMHGGGF